MQDPQTPKPERPSLGWRVFGFVASSGIVLTLLSKVLILQAFEYRASYLAHFNLTYQDFPVAGTAMLALVTQGLVQIGVEVLSRDFLLKCIQQIGKPVMATTIIVLLALWVFPYARNLWLKARRFPAAAPKKSPSGAWGRVIRYVREFAAIVSLTLASYAIVPLALCVLTFGFLSSIILLILPFGNLGTRNAEQFCQQDVSHLNEVQLSDAYADIHGTHQIECAEAKCAVIDDQHAIYVVDRKDILRIKVAPPHAKNAQPPKIGNKTFCPAPR